MRFVDEMAQFYISHPIILQFYTLDCWWFAKKAVSLPQNNKYETYNQILPCIYYYADVVSYINIGAYGYNEF